MTGKETIQEPIPRVAQSTEESDLIRAMGEMPANRSTESFAQAYQTFNSIINRLQRKYIELQEESERQSRLLTEANASLRKMTIRNRAITEFLNGILSSVSSPIMVINKSGLVSHVNPAAERAFGVTSREANGRPVNELLRTPEKSSDLTRALSESQSGVEQEIQIISAEGQLRTYLTTTSPLQDANEGAFGVVAIFQDITQLKVMEKEMARMETLASLGEMAATVAHQVRNPLVVVKGYASLIAAGAVKNADLKQQGERILKGVENLERVIDALLRFSRQEDLHKRPTNLNRYLKKIIRQFSDAHEKTAQTVAKRFEIDLQEETDGKLQVDIDQIILREALNNIITNAYECAGSDVKVKVQLKRSEDGKSCEVSITDNGPGMSKDVQEKIFRPFFTTRNNGSGLGLPLANKIVNAHGGRLSVVTAPGAGATFSVALPLTVATVNDDEDDESADK